MALGTNNYKDFCAVCGMTASEIASFGTAWADMVDAANVDIYNGGWASQTTANGAADIEPAWGRPSYARSWASHYNSAGAWDYYDFGSADACPQSGTVKTAGNCAVYTVPNTKPAVTFTWSQDDLYNISWQVTHAGTVPEVYIDAQAKEWQQISKWATLNGLPKISFNGSMATTTGYTARESWTDLVNRCAADASTALSSLKWATAIVFH